MAKTSFVYRNIFIYRLIMNLLYLGQYKKRFKPVIAHIKKLPQGTRVLEICFGDTFVAEFCEKAGYIWKGLDVNTAFVKRAGAMGFDAACVDIMKLKHLPKAEICILMGSFYHFHPHERVLLEKILLATDAIVVSEPVMNLSAKRGLIGLIAKKSADAGNGQEGFRYDRTSFLNMMKKNSEILGYSISDVEDHGKDLILKVQKHEKC